ncbi:hypothetical protein Tco_0195269 [Tanacetum coccineum]
MSVSFDTILCGVSKAWSPKGLGWDVPRMKVANWNDSPSKSILGWKYRIFTKGQKSSQNGQNQAREWKEREKSKPKTLRNWADYINTPNWNCPAFYEDDDEEYTIAITPIDYLLEEFSSELAHIDLIPPGINEAYFDPEEEIRLVEKLLYDNSSPRPPKEFNSEYSDAIIESFSPSPIPVEDSDSLMERYPFLEELLSNDSPSLLENESFHFDVPSSPRPPAVPIIPPTFLRPKTRRMMEFNPH